MCYKIINKNLKTEYCSDSSVDTMEGYSFILSLPRKGLSFYHKFTVVCSSTHVCMWLRIEIVYAVWIFSCIQVDIKKFNLS